MAQHDAQRRHADHARGLHVFLVALDHASSRAPCARTAPSRCSAIAMISTPKAKRVVRVGKQRAADAGDQQRDQDRRERQHHVAHAHDEGVEPAARRSPPAVRARRRSASTAAPTPAPTSSEMRAPYISAERMSRPWSSVPSRYLAGAAVHPGRRQRASLELERRQVERVVRRDPAGEHRAEDADQGDHRRSRSPPAKCGS